MEAPAEVVAPRLTPISKPADVEAAPEAGAAIRRRKAIDVVDDAPALAAADLRAFRNAVTALLTTPLPEAPLKARLFDETVPEAAGVA